MTRTMIREQTTGMPFDESELRAAMGHFASGVTIVTGLSESGAPVGFTCQSFQSVSLDPPLISICIMNSSTSYPQIRESGYFAVNVLAHSQRHLSQQFARKGTDKWEGVRWAHSALRNPLIHDAALTIDCAITDEIVIGDHTLVIGAVRDFHALDELHPLIFHRGQYRELHQPLRHKEKVTS